MRLSIEIRSIEVFKMMFRFLGSLQNSLKYMLKRRRTVLCFAHGERASAKVVVCYDRGVGRSVVSSYVRSKSAKRCFDFWAPCKIGRKALTPITNVRSVQRCVERRVTDRRRCRGERLRRKH